MNRSAIRRRTELAAVLVAGAMACAGDAATPTGLVARLRAGHPRLWMTEERLAELRQQAQVDPILAAWVTQVLASARSLQGARPPDYHLNSSRGILLEISRRHLDSIASLALAWRWTRDRSFAEAARRWVLNACAYPDWHPDHFLDTAEMTCAVGLGYDWLYESLDAATRRRIEESLIRHGLEAGRLAYGGQARLGWWTRVSHNWNLVCNGGLLVGALAIGDAHPEWLDTIVGSAVTSMPRALASYAPDGGWGEGPSYWGYATTYAAYGLDALRTALGTDFGLADAPGLSKAAVVPLAWAGPTGLYFNFADASEEAVRRPTGCVMWLARTFHDAAAAADEHALIAAGGRPGPWHVVWYVPRPPARAAERPLDVHVRGEVPVIILTSRRGDSNAIWVAVKAGHNRVNHGHLDLGSFVLDALGHRWVRDLGNDSYSLPGYFGRQRWQYLRTSTESHALPLIGGRGQSPKGTSWVERCTGGPTGAVAIVDLSRAYDPPVRRFQRAVGLTRGRGAVVVRDDIALDSAQDVRWGWVTDAAVAPAGAGRLRLRHGDASLEVRAVSPETAEWRVVSVERSAPEASNRGLRRVELVSPSATSHQIEVQFVPLASDGAAGHAAPTPPSAVHP